MDRKQKVEALAKLTGGIVWRNAAYAPLGRISNDCHGCVFEPGDSGCSLVGAMQNGCKPNTPLWVRLDARRSKA